MYEFPGKSIIFEKYQFCSSIMIHRINPSKIPWLLIVVFISITIILLLFGYFYYNNEKSRLKTEQNMMLSSVSSFKITEISKWLQDRKTDGIFISTSYQCIDLFERLVREPKDSLTHRQLMKWLLPIKKNHDYTEISVFDMIGRRILEIHDPGWFYSQSELSEYLKLSSQRKIIFSELLKDTKTRNSFINMIVPINANNRQIGIVVFRINPSITLYPIVDSWPFARITASSCLARLEHDKLLYLYISDSFIEDSASLQRDSIPDDLARKLLSTSALSLIEAKDSRGVDVFANYQNVPGTSWMLISQIDQNEIYSPFKAQAGKIIIYLFGFSLVILVIGVLIWKNQQLQYYRSKFELQSKSDQAEEKVRFMNALLQEVNDAVITFDKDMMIMSWNKGAERIYGWKAEEVVGKFGGGSLRVDFHGASKEQVFHELEEKGSWKGEVIHKRKDGSNAYVLSSTSQLLDENGKILGIMTINKDITELVHSEKIRNAVYRISELSLSSKDLFEMYTSFHVVIGELIDAQNLFIALLENDNQTLTYPYFIDEKETVPSPHRKGNGLTEFVLRTGKPLLARPEDVKYFVDREIIDPPETNSIDWLGTPLRIDNETIGVLVVRSYSIKSRYGEREKDILTFVSEQIALSIHRKKIQQELIGAMQKADVSSKLTSALLANMNHELRTPMNGILGFAEILMNDLEDVEKRSKAENILISGRRLMDTLDAIMDLSYLESDKISRKFKPVSVGKIVRSVLKIYETSINRKTLDLNCLIPVGLTILGDEHLFHHLVKNIVDNAIKYTDKGSITIEASLNDKDGNPVISIVVRDTGIGISKENHEMIFEAFRQVSEGYGRQFEGSGLGLSISKKIVTLMNGEINLKSTPGEGSEFTIFLPAVIDTPVSEPVNVGELLKPMIHRDRSKKMPDVLLVEDNTVNLQLLMVYLKDYCNIYSALDGKSAVEMTRHQKFDLILMDINLGPGMDGIQAMLEIRKRQDYRSVPIIAVTGYASIGDRDRLISTGFTEYLPKPFKKDVVLDIFSSVTSSNSRT